MLYRHPMLIPTTAPACRHLASLTTLREVSEQSRAARSLEAANGRRGLVFGQGMRGAAMALFGALLLAFAPPKALAQTTCEVTSTDDSASASVTIGTLRYCLTNQSSGELIDISATGTITLASALPEIANSMNIAGPGADQLTISGNNSPDVGYIFVIAKGTNVEIYGLTIAEGNSSDLGGGIYSEGALSLLDCTISQNSASTGGGGIYSDGHLTLNSSTVANNSAIGYYARGGGIYNDTRSTRWSYNSTISGNIARYPYDLSAASGAIFNMDSVILYNSTIAGNSATSVGGVESQGSPIEYANSIIAGNTPGDLSLAIGGSLVT